jgi:hypothetical protein
MSEEAEIAGGGGDGGAGGAPSAAELLLGDAAKPVTGGSAAANGTGGEAPAWWNELPADPVGDKPSHKDWVAAKGLQTPADVIASYRALEATLGGEKVVVPKGDDDKDGWERLFKAAGRPDAPEGYALDKIEGIDPALATSFAAKAHEMGLNPKQAAAAVQYQLELVAEAQAAITERNRTEGHAMAAEYGAQWAEEMDRAVRAGLRTGLNPEQVGKMRDAVGPAALFKLLHTVSKAMAEDTLEGGGQGGMGKTLEALQARKAEIQGSPELRKKLLDGDKALMAEWAGISEAEAAAAAKKKAA